VTLGRLGIAAALTAGAGLAIAIYLTSVKLAGGLPVCGPLQGCETVAQSQYSSIVGIPVALVGVAFSATLVVLSLIWWRRQERRAILASYGLGLFGIVFVAYLTYLELFVIGAVCLWCVGYGLTVIGGWIIAALAVRLSGRPPT